MYNVLIVDDEESIRDVLQQILSRSGYHAEIAAGGHEGIQMFDTTPFDLVITDIKMTGIDGYGVARHIRNSHRPFTPIIGISGTPWLLEGDEFDWVMAKPFSLQTLLDAVENLMGRAVTSQQDSPDSVNQPTQNV
ncbi:MAG: response regulator [Desulfobacterales bacterium]|nr:response regulator [Desulfobacterales bacterium]